MLQVKVIMHETAEIKLSLHLLSASSTWPKSCFIWRTFDKRKEYRANNDVILGHAQDACGAASGSVKARRLLLCVTNDRYHPPSLWRNDFQVYTWARLYLNVYAVTSDSRRWSTKPGDKRWHTAPCTKSATHLSPRFRSYAFFNWAKG